MTHTKKRILAMLLAVVLMFSALPFSVSADEVSSEHPTESTVASRLGGISGRGFRSQWRGILRKRPI